MKEQNSKNPAPTLASHKSLQKKIQSLTTEKQQLKSLLQAKEAQIIKLQKNQAYLHNILSNIPGYLYWQDQHGTILGDNKDHLPQAISTTAEEITAHPAANYSGDKPTKNLPKNEINLIKKGESITTEEEIKLPHGHKTINLITKAPLRDVNKKIIGLIGISLDITTRKKIEQALQESKIHEEIEKEKMQAIKLLGSSIAHEMRTPLATISIYLDLMKKMAPNNKKLTHTIQVCKNIIHNTNHFIDMLLVKVKTMATLKQEQKSFTTCVLNHDIEAALEDYPYTDKEKNLVTWKSDAPHLLYTGDTLLTKHIIFNLLKNSLKAMREMEQGKITIELKQNNNYNHVLFTDTASGIDPDLLSHIFNNFTTKNKVETGTGLGLAFCKMVMRSYGGDITCQVKPNKHTRFILSFPKISSK